MKIGLIAVDGTNFPNLPLMKLSAWHKARGDSVEWYMPMTSGHMDKVYMSKIFSFTPDYGYPIDADEIEKGGSGYCISLVDGKEVFDASKNVNLPHDIEHIYPDYSLYGITDTAYGFLSRGCPRGCEFCHVKDKEGRKAYKVADLSEFWRGQKRLVLCDPNILACKEWRGLLQQVIDSNALTNFNQGLDIRLMTDEKAEMLKQIKVDTVHFAWDRYQDKEIVVPRFAKFAKRTGWGPRKMSVYVLCGYDTTFEQDLERIYTLRDLGFEPYVMLYNKHLLEKGSKLRRLQRYVNCRPIFKTTHTFEEYQQTEAGDTKAGQITWTL